MATNKITAIRSLAERIKLGAGKKTKIVETIDTNKLEIAEEMFGNYAGRFDVRINGESVGYFSYGSDERGPRTYKTRPEAFNAIKKAIPNYAYMFK